jgi:hypothetical protein
MPDKEKHPFGEVISEYGDKQAVEDGVLADVSGLGLKAPNGREVNRLTASISSVVMQRPGPSTQRFDLNKAKAMVAACTKESDDWFIGEHEGKTLWLVDNEVDGYTLMYPEDY